MAYRHFSDEELLYVLRAREDGVSYRAIARSLGRAPGAVIVKHRAILRDLDASEQDEDARE